MTKSTKVFLLPVILLASCWAYGQPVWCGNGPDSGPITNIHNNGFDVCFIVPSPGTYTYKYEVRIGSTSGPVVLTGYDTKDHDVNKYTQVTGLAPSTLYYIRAAYETSAGTWSPMTEFRAVTTLSGVYPLPSLNPSKDRNYVIDIAYTTEAQEDIALPAIKEERLVTIQYFDGLGRPLQDIAYQASPKGNDLIFPREYDKFGREAIRYLPYASLVNTGQFRTDAVASPNYSGSPHQQFYANGLADKVVDDNRAFSETVFEDSPLSRPIKSYGPGGAWKSGTTQGDRFIEHQYANNVHGQGASAIEEEVIAWKFNATTGLPERTESRPGFIENGGYYSSGQLFVKVTIDEQGFIVREYTDKSGHVVLRKVQTGSAASNLNSTVDWACTYYIYDDYGKLVIVFPPEAVNALINP